MGSKESIISVPDKRLWQRSQRVGIITNEVKQLVEEMKSATLDWEKNRGHEVGVALAAPQIGSLERVVIVRKHIDDKQSREFEVLINPEITRHEGDVVEEPEGCLSVPDMYGLVPRYETVKVSALDLDGRPIRMKTSGFLARVLQHEIDHLHGKLFVDKVNDDKFYKILNDGKLKPLEQDEIDSARVLWNG